MTQHRSTYEEDMNLRILVLGCTIQRRTNAELEVIRALISNQEEPCSPHNKHFQIHGSIQSVICVTKRAWLIKLSRLANIQRYGMR
jgi:hypothetical protein